LLVVVGFFCLVILFGFVVFLFVFVLMKFVCFRSSDASGKTVAVWMDEEYVVEVKPGEEISLSCLAQASRPDVPNATETKQVAANVMGGNGGGEKLGTAALGENAMEKGSSADTPMIASVDRLIMAHNILSFKVLSSQAERAKSNLPTTTTTTNNNSNNKTAHSLQGVIASSSALRRDMARENVFDLAVENVRFDVVRTEFYPISSNHPNLAVAISYVSIFIFFYGDFFLTHKGGKRARIESDDSQVCPYDCQQHQLRPANFGHQR
jgi:hypothetical protein